MHYLIYYYLSCRYKKNSIYFISFKVIWSYMTSIKFIVHFNTIYEILLTTNIKKNIIQHVYQTIYYVCKYGHLI